MKNNIYLPIRYLGAIILLFSMLSITNSCKKSSSDTSGSNEVYIQNMAFSPGTITVAANTTITWTNNDSMNHTVTSTTGLFDSGSISSGGGTFSHTFTTAGTYPYKCSIHSSMTGTVIVTGAAGGSGY